MTQQELDDYAAEYAARPADDTRKPWEDAAPESTEGEGMTVIATVTAAVRRAARWAATAARTARFLWTVRAAIPWPVRVILALAMCIKMLPVDFGADETLTLIAALILQRTRPGLLKACYRAAQIRA